MKRKIGKSGIEVYAVGLGGMPLSINGRPPEAEGIKVIHAAIDAGVNFIDTANVYCLDDNDIGHNERLIYKALKEKGLDGSPAVTVATKGGCTRPQGAWGVDGSPQAIRKACEQSLSDLNTEAIKLYQLHAPDLKVNFSDTIATLAALKNEGKILHIGLSNVTKEQLKEAQQITRIESVQNRCNAFYKKDVANGMVDFCLEQGISYLPYSPVGGHFGHKKISDYQPLMELAQKHQTSPYCIMLAWLLSKGEHIIPIPGASKVSSILDSVRATTVKLDTEDVLKMDQFPNN
jgi:aryl-alcohol dehydrogenase-like predicted oxidoreductase